MNTAMEVDNDGEIENFPTQPIDADIDSDGDIENFPTEPDRSIVSSYNLMLRDNRQHLMYCSLIGGHHAMIDFDFQVEQITDWVQTLPEKNAKKNRIERCVRTPLLDGRHLSSQMVHSCLCPIITNAQDAGGMC